MAEATNPISAQIGSSGYVPTAAEIAQAQAASAQAAATNAAYLANQLPVLPRMGTPSGGGNTASDLIRIYDTTGLSDPRNQSGIARDVTAQEYYNIYGRTPEQSEATKHAMAFHPEEYFGVSIGSLANTPLSQIASQYGDQFADIVQGHYTEHPTAYAMALTSQYAAQSNRAVGTSGSFQYEARPTAATRNPYAEDSAAGIAWRVGSTGGAVNPFMAQTAIGEAKGMGMNITPFINLPTTEGRFGYSQPVSTMTSRSSVDWGINTTPTRDLSSGMLSGSRMVAGLPNETVTAFMPYGEFLQVAMPGSKLLLSETGELGVYQQPFGHSQFMLTGGGGRAALQSGMFTINKAATPFVANQWEVGNVTMPSGEGMSRLGAEAYGGYVRPLNTTNSDNLLAPNSQFSYFPGNPYNLANFVSPESANKGKAELPGANIPWEISPSSPAIQRMDQYGVIPGSAIAIPSTNSHLTGGNMVAGIATTGGISSTTTSPYAYRNDPVAVILEGALFLGDSLTFGLWKPGAALLTEKGQNVNPAMDSFNADMANIKSQEGKYSTLGSHIETQRSEIDSMLVGKTNAQGQFTGTPEEYTKYKSLIGDLTTDVGKYNEFSNQQKSVMEKGFASGAILSTGSGGYVVNPDNVKEYGAFSDWSRGAGQWIQRSLGQEPVTTAQFMAYEQTPEFKNANPIMQLGEGGYKILATNPASIGSSFIQGVEIYTGMGILSAGLGVAAGAGGTVGAAGAAGQTVLNSAAFQYGLGGLLVAGTVLDASDWGRNTQAQTMSNLGGAGVHLTAMGWGGFAPEILSAGSRSIGGIVGGFGSAPNTAPGGNQYYSSRSPFGNGPRGGYEPGPSTGGGPYNGGGPSTGGGPYGSGPRIGPEGPTGPTFDTNNLVYRGHAEYMTNRQVALTEHLDRGDLMNNLEGFNRMSGFGKETIPTNKWITPEPRASINPDQLLLPEGRGSSYVIERVPSGTEIPYEKIPSLSEDLFVSGAAQSTALDRIVAYEPTTGKVIGAAAYHAEGPSMFVDYIGSMKPGVGSTIVGNIKTTARVEGLSSITGESVPRSTGFWEKMGAELNPPTRMSQFNPVVPFEIRLGAPEVPVSPRQAPNINTVSNTVFLNPAANPATSSPLESVQFALRHNTPEKVISGAEYIRARYPGQESIWERYLTDVQQLHPTRRTPQEQMERQTIDLREGIDWSNAKITYKEPLNINLRESFEIPTAEELKLPNANVATAAERAMVIQQYGLTPEEIAYARANKSSLNDILAIRETTTTPIMETFALNESSFGTDFARTSVVSQDYTKAFALSSTVRNGMDQDFARVFALSPITTPAPNYARSFMLTPEMKTMEAQDYSRMMATSPNMAISEAQDYARAFALSPAVATVAAQDYSRVFALSPATTSKTAPAQDYARAYDPFHITQPVVEPTPEPKPGKGYVPPYVPPEIPPFIPKTPVGFPWGGGGGAGGGGGKRYKRQLELFSFDLNSATSMENPFAIPSGKKRKGK